jgi:hypothetical protein
MLSRSWGDRQAAALTGGACDDQSSIGQLWSSMETAGTGGTLGRAIETKRRLAAICAADVERYMRSRGATWSPCGCGRFQQATRLPRAGRVKVECGSALLDGNTA